MSDERISMTTKQLNALLDREWDKGAADMRERARVLLADGALATDDRAVSEALHDYAVYVATLPLAAPSAGPTSEATPPPRTPTSNPVEQASATVLRAPEGPLSCGVASGAAPEPSGAPTEYSDTEDTGDIG